MWAEDSMRQIDDSYKGNCQHTLKSITLVVISWGGFFPLSLSILIYSLTQTVRNVVKL